jgi:hypothetical protein
MNSQSLFRICVLGLLAASVTTQALILARLPKPSPTVGDIRTARIALVRSAGSARDEARNNLQAISYKLPVVQVDGVNGTVDVDVQNTLPIPVNIEK